MMRYLAKFISGDGLTKREFVPRPSPNCFRVWTVVPIWAALSENGLPDVRFIGKREYQLVESYQVKKDLVYLEYREI